MAPKQGELTPEAAVRNYLTYLADPTSLRDEAEITRLRAEHDQATDPIDRLRMAAALERAQAVDATTFEAGFIANAKTWADQEGIPVSAFQSLGVSDDVLAASGFDLPARRRGRGRPAATAPSLRRRAKSVSLEEIKAHIRNWQGTFVLADIAEKAGGSAATIRKAVDDLIGSGEVEKLGPVPEHNRRGRVPTQYGRTSL